MDATDAHALVELLEAAFPVKSLQRLYKEEQLQLRENLETAVRRAGVSCETVAGQ
jgi:hypothetical protein